MIIGLSGKKRSGKDTVADIVCNMYPSTIKYAFASPLKLEVATATGFSLKYIEEHKSNFRLILQGWGTDFRREIYGKDYWIRKMEEALKLILSTHEHVVIPDVRFLNEYEFVKSLGGVMIRIERAVDYSDTHVSENELDHTTFDHVIVNDGTERDLVDKIKQLKLIVIQ